MNQLHPLDEAPFHELLAPDLKPAFLVLIERITVFTLGFAIGAAAFGVLGALVGAVVGGEMGIYIGIAFGVVVAFGMAVSSATNVSRQREHAPR